MNRNNFSHTFVVCAYGESPYLENCILSLLNQKKKTGILLATSTPNEHIAGISEKYGIPIYVNHGEKGAGRGLEFCLQLCRYGSGNPGSSG